MIKDISKRLKSLSFFILIVILIVSLISSGTAYLIITSIYKHLLETQALKLSDTLSKQVFNSMYQVMKKGWNRRELKEFLETFNNTDNKSPYTINVWRGAIVSELFGRIDENIPSDTVSSAIRDEKDISRIERYNISYVYVIKARKECLSCHVNAHVGSTLGALEVTQDIKNKIIEAQDILLRYFFILFPIPLFIALVPALFVRSKVLNPTLIFKNKLKEINSVKDLKTIEQSDLNLGFTEFNNIFLEVKSFITKLKDVAIDKEIMEFEINILKKLMITSDVIFDWKALVSRLLTELSKVINACALFSIFYVDEGIFDIEVFWINTPQESIKNNVERVINKLILNDKSVFKGSSSFNVTHNIIDETIELTNIIEAEIELKMKTMILDNPLVGGVIGVGIHSDISKDSVRALLIEGVLTTLMSIVGSIRAIYKSTKDLEFFATRDPLTGLYNQRLFWDLLISETSKARRHKGKFVVIMIDFDKFKLINDIHGHKFGDDFLKTYSSVISGQLRQSDILCRYGGDEFGIILPETPKDNAMIVAERIKDAIENTSMISPSKDTVNATISIGMAAFPDHADNDRDIFLIADSMLYKSKEAGRNAISVPSEQDISNIYKEMTEKSFLVLKAVDDNLLIPYFQPIIDIASKKILGHELLMRIVSGTEVTPAREFLEFAGNSGLMQDMDFILMGKAFQKMTEERYSDNLFVNITIKGLKINEFVSRLMKLITKHNIDPKKIIFEVSEKEILKNMGLFEKLVIELKAKGFRFVIEGFGHELTSFQYIRHFSLDYIKIHNSLLKSSVTDIIDRAYLRSILTLCHELNIAIIAEFIECSEDVLLAANEKIQCCQGFYTGKPQPEFMKTY